mmetsp:Transcript_95173/g.269386  ORF Transcript_95173/g.269386 Transcript_95173/m.269386 type:complete len:247 (+) Transcript_95173:44-784(+)
MRAWRRVTKALPASALRPKSQWSRSSRKARAQSTNVQHRPSGRSQWRRQPTCRGPSGRSPACPGRTSLPAVAPATPAARRRSRRRRRRARASAARGGPSGRPRGRRRPRPRRRATGAARSRWRRRRRRVRAQDVRGSPCGRPRRRQWPKPRRPPNIFRASPRPGASPTIPQTTRAAGAGCRLRGSRRANLWASAGGIQAREHSLPSNNPLANFKFFQTPAAQVSTACKMLCECPGPTPSEPRRLGP